MNVERLKYVIWAADMGRAVQFYTTVFGGTVLKQNEVISEVSICEGIIGIHGGGEGKRTWTGLSFQVADVIAGAQAIVAAGGQLTREPQHGNILKDGDDVVMVKELAVKGAPKALKAGTKVRGIKLGRRP